MRAMLLVAAVDLKRRLRNRSALFTAILGPLAMAVVFGVLLGGTDSISLKIGIVDLDRSEISRPFVDGLLRADADSPVTFVVELEATVRDAVDDGDLGAAIVVPAGFGAAVTSGDAATLTVLRDPSREISAGVSASIAEQYLAGLGSRRLAAVTAIALGGPPPTATELAELRDSVVAAVVDEHPGGAEIDAAAYYGVSMSVLFLFFTVAFAARSLIVERRTGLVPRVLAASTPAWSIVLGKVLAVCILGMAGFATVWLTTRVLFGADWGDPLAVLVTMAATTIAVGGVAVFVCGLARTEQQADGWTSMVAFALALLGGNFVGPGQAPDALQRLAVFTPNGQSLDAFTALAVDRAGIGGIAGHLAVLIAIASVFGAVGLTLLGRAVRR